MKKTALLITVIILCTFTLSMADGSYSVITKDNEVQDLDAVQVKKTITTSTTKEEVITIRDINAKIATIQARIDHLQGDIESLNTLKSKVTTEASKVTLKKAEPMKDIEEVK